MNNLVKFMKRFLILSLLLGMSGCNESSTGLKKNAINAAYKNCYGYLNDRVESPSSLKINKATPKISFPEDNLIYKYFNESLIDKNTGKISQENIDENTRFRQISFAIYYEVKNSNGVSLIDKFVCSYVYELKGKEESPNEMYLTSWETKNEIKSTYIPLDVRNETNFRMDQKIVKPITEISSHFTDRDKLLFTNIEFLYKDSNEHEN